jgi:hypothetical protein
MTVRHCPGCKGYDRGLAGDCPGMSMGEFETPDVVPPLRFSDRLRVLIGLPVLLGVTPGPLDDPGLPEYPGPVAFGQDWKDQWGS